LATPRNHAEPIRATSVARFPTPLARRHRDQRLSSSVLVKKRDSPSRPQQSCQTWYLVRERLSPAGRPARNSWRTEIMRELRRATVNASEEIYGAMTVEE